jgi:hypothetical protein
MNRQMDEPDEICIGKAVLDKCEVAASKAARGRLTKEQIEHLAYIGFNLESRSLFLRAIGDSLLPPCFRRDRFDFVAALKAIVAAVEKGETAKRTKIWAAQKRIAGRIMARRAIAAENAQKKTMRETIKSSSWEPRTGAEKDRFVADQNFAKATDKQLPALESKAIADEVGASPETVRKAARRMKSKAAPKKGTGS